MAYLKDPYWEHDLLWYYLYQKNGGPLRSRNSSTKYERWLWVQYLKHVDISGIYNDRRSVYQLLVDKPEHTLARPECTVYNTRPRGYERIPRSSSGYRLCKNKSLIPWNQNNPALLRSQKGAYTCGSIVLAFFARYMNYRPRSFKSTVPPSHLNSIEKEAWIQNICNLIARQLSNKIPVRIGLGNNNHTSHYVGIVAVAKGKNNREFLAIEPWAGNHPIRNQVWYATQRSEFLARIKYNNSRKILEDPDYGDVVKAEMP